MTPLFVSSFVHCAKVGVAELGAAWVMAQVLALELHRVSASVLLKVLLRA